MADAMPARLGETLAAARLTLAGVSDTAGLDVRLLAAEAFGLDAAGLILKEHEPADIEAALRLHAMIARRMDGEPVHRILGRRAFCDHEFALSPDTLEPRPDTEVLVDLAARALSACSASEPVFADLGTGTGAIAVSLLALFPGARCVAVDLAPGALATARRNAGAAGVDARFWPVAGDYLASLRGPLEFVISNPPYIKTGEIDGLSDAVRRFDPTLALDGGEDGLSAYRAIARGAEGLWPRPSGVLLEIGAGQRDDVIAIMSSSGYRLREEARDLSGHVRALWLTCERR